MLRNRRISQVLLAVALSAACAAGASAQSLAGAHAKISLLADGRTLQPGHTDWVGLYFDLEPGWHIYWVNPGDSGERPRVTWTLPQGFQAGDIRWPAPVRLTTGSVIDYGYQGRVLLAVPLQVPAVYNPGAPAMLAADVKYLICRDVCIPASAHAVLQLPRGKAATPDVPTTHQLFEDTRVRWPKPLPPTAKVQASDDGKSFVLSFDTGAPEAKAFFFPLEEDQMDNDAPQTVTTAGTRTQITLKKSGELHKPISVLKGVVVLGPDRAYQIAAPVSARH